VKRCVFWFLEYGTIDNVKNPVIVSVTHHRQNPLEFIRFSFFNIILSFSHFVFEVAVYYVININVTHVIFISGRQ
jgi:hypothetical protein